MYLDLLAYLREFDMDLSDLEPEQLGMFVAARNAARYVEDLELPIASRPHPGSETTLVEVETEKSIERTAYYMDLLESRLPADEMDVRQIEGAEDLPRIFPTQWLLEELDPDLFYLKLAQRELLMPQWQRATQGPQDSYDEVRQRELIQERAVARSAKLHAYVLLDTSRTMNDHDRRGTIARGLALAFLRKGHEQRARLNLRPFTAQVGELSTGVGKDDFRAIAERIVRLPNSGQTRIQTALEQAVQDIRTAGPCLGAGIMLITDGISRLSQSPLTHEKLHTFLLGDLFEKEGAAGTVSTLKQWSATFRRIWTNRFAEILAPTLDDCRAAADALQAILDEANEHGAPGIGRKLRRASENVKFLLRQFKRSLGKAGPPTELASLEKQLSKAEAAAAMMPAEPTSAPAPDQASARAASAEMAWSGGASGNRADGRLGLWALIRRIAAWLLRRIKRWGRRPRIDR